MAVPKSKKSKSKTNSRFANWKLKEQNLVRCPQCHEFVKQHNVCPNCGAYDGKVIVDQDTQK